MGHVFKNTIYLIGAEQLARVVNFFQVILLTRYLGTDNYGIWSLTQSLPGMFVVVTDLGINSIMLRRIASQKFNQRECVEQVIVLKILMSVLFVSIVYGFTKLSRYDPEIKLLINISAIAYGISSFSEVIMAVYRSLEKFSFEAIINASRNLLFLSLTMLVVLLDFKLLGLVYGQLLLGGLVTLFCICWYKRKHGLGLKLFELSHYRRLVGESLPFAVLGVISPIYFQIDIVMLSQLSSYSSVGLYNAAYRIILFLYVIPVTVRRTLFSRFSVLHASSSDDFKRTFESACRIMTLLALPVATGLCLLSDKIIPMLFSSVFSQSAIPLKILSITVPFYFLRSIFESALYAAGFEKLAVLLFASGTVLNIALDYVLISKFDVTGAAVAALLSEMMLCLGYYVLIGKQLFKLQYQKTGLKIILSTVVMGIFVKMTDSLFLPIQILLGFFVYIASLCFLKVFIKEEYKIILRSMKNLFQNIRKQNNAS